jgi:hypothetical protein
MSMILDGSLGVTFNDASLQGAAASPYVLKNRIINGDMVIDQRNAGASQGTTTLFSNYTLDRWQAQYSAISKFTTQQNAGSVTPPVGFTNYLGCTSSSAYTVGASEAYGIAQYIEGYNAADLGWGTANAKTVTLSFQVYSSLTGTFGGALRNSAGNRSYPYSYTISNANTWEQKTITIAGDTSGTWLTTNGIGIQVFFNIGAGATVSGTAGAWAGAGLVAPTGAVSVVGTNGATFYITGVQLEQNTSATPFERRLYNQELANCQRYFEKSYDQTTVPASATANGMHTFPTSGTTNVLSTAYFSVEKRTSPTITIYDGAGTAGVASWWDSSATQNNNSTQAVPVQSQNTRNIIFRISNNIAGSVAIGYQWIAVAEL